LSNFCQPGYRLDVRNLRSLRPKHHALEVIWS
jgi:hypothetical protein